MTLTEYILILIFLPVILSFFTYWERREKINQTCIKESKLQTFIDECYINFLLVLTTVTTVYLIIELTQVWSNG